MATEPRTSGRLVIQAATRLAREPELTGRAFYAAGLMLSIHRREAIGAVPRSVADV